MKTNDKYTAPESEVIEVIIESNILDGSTEGSHGCTDDSPCDFE